MIFLRTPFWRVLHVFVVDFDHHEDVEILSSQNHPVCRRRTQLHSPRQIVQSLAKNRSGSANVKC